MLAWALVMPSAPSPLPMLDSGTSYVESSFAFATDLLFQQLVGYSLIALFGQQQQQQLEQCASLGRPYCFVVPWLVGPALLGVGSCLLLEWRFAAW
jgi:hypothetical protein